jgi:hypothetical protein
MVRCGSSTNDTQFLILLSPLCRSAYSKALISKISCYNSGDRAYPDRNLPAGNNDLPFEEEPQGVSYGDDEKNSGSKLEKRILAQLSSPPVGMEAGLFAGLYSFLTQNDRADDGIGVLKSGNCLASSTNGGHTSTTDEPSNRRSPFPVPHISGSSNALISSMTLDNAGTCQVWIVAGVS